MIGDRLPEGSDIPRRSRPSRSSSDRPLGPKQCGLFFRLPPVWQDSQVLRGFKAFGFILAGLLVLNWVLGLLVRPKPHRLVGPSGHVYGILSDLVSADGHYFLVYDASESDPTTLSREVDDLREMLTRDQRARLSASHARPQRVALELRRDVTVM